MYVMSRGCYCRIDRRLEKEVSEYVEILIRGVTHIFDSWFGCPVFQEVLHCCVVRYKAYTDLGQWSAS